MRDLARRSTAALIAVVVNPLAAFLAFVAFAALASLAAFAAVPPVPATPAPVKSVLLARSFVLDEPFAYEWSADHAPVTKGTLLVLEADPALARTRETAEPILFVGQWPAERVARGTVDGRIAVFVPGEVDLAKDLVWFGTPGLPEQVDAATVLRERGRAVAAHLEPLPRAMVAAARAKGGPAARFATKADLLRAIEEAARGY